MPLRFVAQLYEATSDLPEFGKIADVLAQSTGEEEPPLPLVVQWTDPMKNIMEHATDAPAIEVAGAELGKLYARAYQAAVYLAEQCASVFYRHTHVALGRITTVPSNAQYHRAMLFALQMAEYARRAVYECAKHSRGAAAYVKDVTPPTEVPGASQRQVTICSSLLFIYDYANNAEMVRSLAGEFYENADALLLRWSEPAEQKWTPGCVSRMLLDTNNNVRAMLTCEESDQRWEYLTIISALKKLDDAFGSGSPPGEDPRPLRTAIDLWDQRRVWRRMSAYLAVYLLSQSPLALATFLGKRES